MMTLTLAVMTRATPGHTSRPLNASRATQLSMGRLSQPRYCVSLRLWLSAESQALLHLSALA